jgi:hypothetical protein
VLVFAAQCALHWGTLRDDAFISFRYGARLAQGDGLTFNDGQRVEGYTNFSWVLLCALGSLLGADLTLLMPALGATAGLLLVVGTAVVATRLAARDGELSNWTGSVAALLTALLPSTAYYAVTGMETTLYALLFLVAVWALTEDRISWFCAATFLAFLTRPEAGLIGLGGVAWLVWRHKLSPNVWKPVLALSIAVGAYLSFKQLYFGSIFPNTMRAKPPDESVVWRYAQDAGVRLTAIAIVGALLSLKRGSTRILLVVFITHTIAVASFGADWMPGLRMLVPVLPVAFLLADRTLTSLRPRLRLATRVACVAVTIASVAVWFFPFRNLWHVSARTRSYDPIRADMYGMLDQRGVRSFGTVDIGLPGYLFPDWRILDLGGLTDDYIARQPGGHVAKVIPTEYLAKQAPDVFGLSSQKPPIQVPGGGFDLDVIQPVERGLMKRRWFHETYRYGGSVPLTEEYFYHLFYRRDLLESRTAPQ